MNKDVNINLAKLGFVNLVRSKYFEGFVLEGRETNVVKQVAKKIQNQVMTIKIKMYSTYNSYSHIK